MLLLYFVVAGLLLGAVTRGRFAALADVRFRWWALALGGMAFQVLLFGDALGSRVGAAGPALYVLSTAVVLAALLRNVRLAGFPIIALGASINLAVIVANGGQMPAEPNAFAALNGLPIIPTALFSNSILAGSHTVLPFLGDVMVLPRPLPFANVFSIGDVIIGLGAMVFIVRTMHAGRVAPDVAPPLSAGLGQAGVNGP